MAALARLPLFPKPGVFRGATPNASAGRWWDANLVRWRGGQVQPIGGNVSFPGVVLDSPGRDLLTWHDNHGTPWIAVGTDNKLYAYNMSLGALHDITPAGVGAIDPPGAYVGYGLANYGAAEYGTPRIAAGAPLLRSVRDAASDADAVLGDMWSMDLFGEDLLIVPTQDGHLFRWKPSTPTAVATVVAAAPWPNIGVIVTDERHVVLIGAAGDARRVAWSAQENPDDWTPTVSNLAGDLQLESEGRPLYARRVVGGNLIWTDNDCHMLKYVGPPYAYGLNKLAANCGLISRRAVSRAGATIIWMGAQSFWTYTGSVMPLNSDISDWLFSIMNRRQVGLVFGMPNPTFPEHWFFFPSEDSTENNRYVVMNYGEPGQPWTIGQMNRACGDPRGSFLKPVMGGYDKKLYLHETGWLDDGASRSGRVYVETGDVLMGEGDGRWHVKQIMQDYDGPEAAIGYRFFISEEVDGPETDLGVTPITNDSGKTDIRFSCRQTRMRIENIADAQFSIGKTRLLTRPGGRR